MKLLLSDSTLERVTVGDEAALERVVVAYDPVLRMVVRRRFPRHLRVHFDSADVVQSVWGHLLEGLRQARWQFASPGHLGAFLVRAARNRLFDRLRRQNTALRREQASAPAPEEVPGGREASAEAVAEADDLWQRLLLHCPVRHRKLLSLKRQGFSVGEIAARTGLHPGSVRRILYDLASRSALDGAAGTSARGG